MVSALRRSRAVSAAVLQKVAEHVVRSAGRACCQHETVPLQFVFGPEQSLEKFRQVGPDRDRYPTSETQDGYTKIYKYIWNSQIM